MSKVSGDIERLQRNLRDAKDELKSLGLTTQAQIEQLDVFAQTLAKWNKSFNFVSRQDMNRLVDRHLIDSLHANAWLTGTQILDVGSGAGLPGIPLAIARPECHFVLLDRHERRMRFVEQVSHQLGLENVTVIVQNLLDKQWQADHRGKFDTVVSRAVLPPVELWEGCCNLLGTQGRMIAFYSTTKEQELEQKPDEQVPLTPLPAHFKVVTYEAGAVPGDGRAGRRLAIRQVS